MTLECPPDLALACEGNDVDEIFGNLLDNAFKFARTGVVCTARPEGRWVSIEITDDGAGLAPDQVTLVLRPGRRLDESVPGFGFGLTIARELVELYGGGLQFQTGGPGLKVTTTLPLALDRR